MFEVDEHNGEPFFTGAEADVEAGTTEFRLTVRAGNDERSMEQRTLMSITRVPEFAVAGGRPDALAHPAPRTREPPTIRLRRIAAPLNCAALILFLLESSDWSRRVEIC